MNRRMLSLIVLVCLIFAPAAEARRPSVGRAPFDARRILWVGAHWIRSTAARIIRRTRGSARSPRVREVIAVRSEDAAVHATQFSNATLASLGATPDSERVMFFARP